MQMRLPAGVAWVMIGMSVADGVRAGVEVDERHPAPATGLVQIFNPRGDVEVRGWDRAEVRVLGELDDAADGLSLETGDEGVLVRVDLPLRNLNWGDGSDLEIWVPERSSVIVDAVSADVDLERIAGRLAVSTVSGDVKVDGPASEAQINTVSGDVEITGTTGKLVVVTLSGSLKARVSAAVISVDTMSGEVELELEAIDSLVASSVSGDVEVEGRLNAEGQITVETVNGDIELELAGPVNARLRATVVAGGSIVNGFSPDQPEKSFPGLRLDSVIGDGAGRITLSTVNGEVELRPK